MEEPVQAIRETSRDFLLRNRRKQKDEHVDVRRCFVDLRITQPDVTTISHNLKSKSSISSSDLKVLQNALIDDPKNVAVLLNTHGALRGLVRELSSGHDVSKQCAACNCLCNLALGESKVCCIIAKAASVYLVAALDTLTTQLALSSVWTIGNLAGSGTTACELLIAQGALAKLCDVMQRHSDVQEAAVYALTHAAFVMKDDLRSEHLHKIVQSLSKTELNVDSSLLLFIISCHRDFSSDTLPEGYLQRIVDKLTVSMEHHLNICNVTKHDSGPFVNPNASLQNSKSTSSCNKRPSVNAKGKECCELVYILRVLANLNSKEVYSDLSSYFVSNNLLSNIRRLLLEVNVNKSLLWLLGNIMYCCSDCDVFFNNLIC